MRSKVSASISPRIAGAGGDIFGLVYLLQPRPRSILPSILVHGFVGTGFFNGGDAIL